MRYQDRVFCSYYKECRNGGSCSSALTDEVRAAAKADGLVVSQFAIKPECFRKVTRDNNAE